MSHALPEQWPGIVPLTPPLVLALPVGAPDLVARLAGGLRSADPALVLLFGNPAPGLTAVGAGLGAALGADCRVIGCSSAGEIGPGGYGSDSLIALGFPAESFRAGVFVLDHQARVPVSEWMAGLRRFHAAFRPRPQRACFGVLLADAQAGHEDVLIATLEAAIPGLPVVGGSAARGLGFGPSCQMIDGQDHAGAAIFVLIETDLAVAEISFAHFRPTGRRAVVTAADPYRRIIHELNAEPAAGEYARLAGLRLAGLTASDFARHPLLQRAGRRHHVRAIRAVTPDGGLQLMSGIETGNILTLGRPVDMTRGFAKALEALPRPPLLVLGFDCILRRLALERAGMMAQMSELLVGAHVAGFNTYGEQHGGMHVNQTFVGIALMPPAPV